MVLIPLLSTRGFQGSVRRVRRKIYRYISHSDRTESCSRFRTMLFDGMPRLFRGSSEPCSTMKHNVLGQSNGKRSGVIRRIGFIQHARLTSRCWTGMQMISQRARLRCPCFSISSPESPSAPLAAQQLLSRDSNRQAENNHILARNSVERRIRAAYRHLSLGTVDEHESTRHRTIKGSSHIAD